MSRRISGLVGEEHGAILQAQLMILEDHTIERPAPNGELAARVVTQVVAGGTDVFEIHPVDGVASAGGEGVRRATMVARIHAG